MDQAWKTDLYKFVGKSFDFAYANRLNKLLAIMGEENSNSVDFELTGTGGYGELREYTGELNKGDMKRGFKTIITPGEFSLTIPVGYKQAKIDKTGECKKVGKRLGDSAAMTVYTHALRMFGNAFNADYAGGDGKAWAATDHPCASKGSQGRKYIADPEAGTYSNLIKKALSVDAITEAQTVGGKLLTPDGLPFLADYNTLLVSPDLEAEAKKICGDGAKLRPTGNPGDDTNAANPLYDLHYMVIGGGELGFAKKQWAICDATLMKELCKIVYITRPTVFDNGDTDPLKENFTGYVDFGLGWGDARQIIFSNPA